MNTLRMAILIALVLGVGFMTSCSTSVKGVKQSKDFVYEDIINGGMAIGGVFSIFEELTPKAKNRNATNLQLSIQEEREDYPLTPMPEVRNTLGRDNYEKFMDEYATDGILSKPTLNQLKAGLKERFLVVVRIENDDIGESNYSRVNARKDSRGRLVEKPGTMVRRNRTIIVTAHVYDLLKGKSVWNGQVKSWGTETKKYPLKTTSDLDALAALINLAQGGKLSADDRTIMEKYPPPRPPPLFRLLPKAFEAFADELPDD